jgi:hypothetical protein
LTHNYLTDQESFAPAGSALSFAAFQVVFDDQYNPGARDPSVAVVSNNMSGNISFTQ